MLRAKYTQDTKMFQIHGWINVKFYIWIKIDYYFNKHKQITNKMIDCKHEIIDDKDELSNCKHEIFYYKNKILDCKN